MNRKLLFTVILSMLIPILIFAQSKKAQADSLYTAKNYLAAAPAYIEAASSSEFKLSKAENFYNAACCFALSGDKEAAFEYLEKARKFGWNNKDHLLQDADL